ARLRVRAPLRKAGQIAYRMAAELAAGRGPGSSCRRGPAARRYRLGASCSAGDESTALASIPAGDGGSMRIATSLLGLLLICASAAAEPATETLRFAIIRNGDQIGTHTIELKRSGQEIAVNIE